MDAIMHCNNTDHVTGFAARNQLYYDIMTRQSVKDPKTLYTRAPEYIRACAAAAFTYGAQNTPEDVIPSEYIAAYNDGKGSYNDDDLQEIMDLLIAGVELAE